MEGRNAGRGDDTRLRLIEAALEVFSERGYAAATTRDLASRAGVNLAAIPYHFGGKEALYLAVAGHVAGRIRSEMADAVGAATGLLQDPTAGRETLLAQLGVVTDEARGGAEVQVRPRGRGALGEGVQMGHDVMARLAFDFAHPLEIVGVDLEMGPHLLERGVGDFETEPALGLRERQPQPSPGGVAVARREQTQHFR